MRVLPLLDRNSEPEPPPSPPARRRDGTADPVEWDNSEAILAIVSLYGDDDLDEPDPDDAVSGATRAAAVPRNPAPPR